MEMIDRYVYAVTRRLPSVKRKEAEGDLRETIAARLQAAAPDEPDQSVRIERILRELGHPALRADHYRGGGQHLIGPDLYYLYELVLKIVLLAVGGGLLIAMAIKFLVNGAVSLLPSLLETIGSLLTGLIGAFGWVTLIFAAIDRYAPERIQGIKSETFDPADLPSIPQGKDRIPPADPIASMVFILVAMVAAFYAPDFLGYHRSADLPGDMIPLFTESVYRDYLPFIWLILGIGLIQEIAKLRAGRWSVPLSIFHLLLDLPGLVLTVVMFNDPNLFNGQFFTELFAIMLSSDPMLLGLPMPFFISRTVIALAVLGLIVDVIVTVVRVLRSQGGAIHLTAARRD